MTAGSAVHVDGQDVADQALGDAPVVLRVLLVDDHAVVRRGLRAFLDVLPDMTVVGEAADGQAALGELTVMAAAGVLPDVVLMDLMMPRMDGITAIRAVKECFPDLPVVAMTSFSEDERVRAALTAGAAGYLLKDAGADAVAAALRAAHAGGLHLDPAIARAATGTSTTRSDAAVLTAREREVVTHVAEGLSNKQIAAALSISERTARTHVSNILLKLDLPSRTQAALWAIKQGLALGP